MKIIIMMFISIFLLISTAPAKAVDFWVAGAKIKRTLTRDVGTHGGCMILLTKSIGNGCPNNGWVSLDCKGEYFPESVGSRNYATAIVAASMNKTVSVLVNNNKKHSGYCVAERLDVIYIN